MKFYLNNQEIKNMIYRQLLLLFTIKEYIRGIASYCLQELYMKKEIRSTPAK